jgi:hypothetical protein
MPGNAVLLLNAHYVNANAAPVEPDVRINVWTIPDEAVQAEGGILFWYNPFIRVEPMGTGLAEMSCPIPHDITISNTQSHMHRRGVGYAASIIDDAGSPAEVIYENTAWEGVPVKRFEGGLHVPAGKRIEYFCAYENPETRTVWQGPRSSDEMCMYIASYWPARPEVSNCAADPNDVQRTQNLNARWTGQGTATCAQSLVCVQQIEATDFDGFIQGLTSCVLGARPESSEAVSAGVRCLLTKANPEADCQPEIQACLNE